MPVTIRKATLNDATLLVRVVDLASEGLVPKLWEEMAPPDADASGVGLGLILAEEGEFSYRNGLIAEIDGVKMGGLIGYVLPTTPKPIDPDVPDAFVGIEELSRLSPGFWYINFMAVLPEGRRHGVGAALLDKAEDQARKGSCPGLALIVAASNDKAMRIYRRAGYAEKARRPFDLSAFGGESTEAILMVKVLD